MDIGLGLVDTFTPKVVVHLLDRDTLVIDVRLLINEVPVRLSRNRLE